MMKPPPVLYLGMALLCASTVGLGIGRWRAASSPPRIHIAAPIWDFGTVSGEQPKSHTFNIENTGGQPLVISDLTKSCGCVQTAELKDSVIPPGGKLPLKVTIEVTPNDQDIREQVSIYDSNSKNPISVVSIKGHVRPIVSIVPPIVNFGILTQEDLKQTQQLIISKRGAEGRGDSPIVTLPSSGWHSKVWRQGAKQWTVSLGLASDTPIGPLDSSILIEPTWGSARNVPVLGEVLGPVEANPKEIYQSLAQSKKGDVTIRINGSDKVVSVKVLSLTPNLARFLRHQIQGNDSIKFRYDLSSLKVMQPLSGRCLLEALSSQGKTFKIAVPIIFAK